MLESLAEKCESLLNAAAAFLWEQFEKDLELTEAILARTEKVWAKIETYFRL